MKRALAEVCAALTAASVEHWVIGGYGVELVVGQSLRSHQDIDLFVSLPHAERAAQTLESLGFRHCHGSLEAGDVFHERNGVLIDLVPIDTSSNPPLTIGEFGGLVWPKGLLTPHEVVKDAQTFKTLTPKMHLEMKRVVAALFDGELREKDRIDMEALQRLLGLS